MNILKVYLREHMSQICMYSGFMGTFAVIFFLYNVRGDAVKYAFFLSFLCLLAYGLTGLLRFGKHYRKLMWVRSEEVIDLSGLPPALSAVEAEYQQMLSLLQEKKAEAESDGLIARQDMLDYYGMWVHQIKTPLSAMALLLQSYDAKEEADIRFVRDLRMELFKVEQYVEMVLVYLRMEDMSSDLSFAEFSLDDLIRQAVRKYSRMFIMKKIKLDYETVNSRVLTDEKWLVFVLEQLLSNALKYTRSGRISIHMEGKELVVEDTGIGIQAEDLPRVFEKGFTGYNGRTDKKSTGIGLYLCKSVMDKLRHQIRIESEVGIGTKIYLNLTRL